MNEISYLSAFLIGLAGGVHCVGMCGGIVAALTSATPVKESSLPYAISYNTGRIVSYTIAGAIAGGLGQMSISVLPQIALFLSLTSAFILIALALYLGNIWQGLARIEQLGGRLWKKLQPLSKRFIPFKRPLSAFPYGVIWGWLPCGLVYSALTWSLTSSNVVDGALIMVFFGLGTMPTLLVASSGVQYIVSIFKHPISRKLIAFSLLIYAFVLIYQQLHSIN